MKSKEENNQAAVDKLTPKQTKKLDFTIFRDFLMDYKKKAEEEWEVIEKAPRTVLEDVRIDTVVFSEKVDRKKLEELKEIANSSVIHEGIKPTIRVMPNSNKGVTLEGFTMSNTNLLPKLLSSNIGKGITSIELLGADPDLVVEQASKVSIHLHNLSTKILGHQVKSEVDKLVKEIGAEDVNIQGLLEDLIDKSNIVGWELGRMVDTESYRLTLETNPILSRGLMNIDNFHASDLVIATKIAELARLDILKYLVTNVFELKFRDMLAINNNHISYDVNSRTLRNEATPAAEGDIVLISSEVDKGIIFAIGKGNKDWNESAPSRLTETDIPSEQTEETVDMITIIKTIYNEKGEVENE